MDEVLPLLSRLMGSFSLLLSVGLQWPLSYFRCEGHLYRSLFRLPVLLFVMTVRSLSVYRFSHSPLSLSLSLSLSHHHTHRYTHTQFLLYLGENLIKKGGGHGDNTRGKIRWIKVGQTKAIVSCHLR